MGNLAIGVGTFVLTFLLGYAGMHVQKLLPESHMTSGARDMIGAVMGLITLLLALVLGTLVGSAYGFYATQKANVETLAARAHHARYGLQTVRAGSGALARGLAGLVRAGLQGDLGR